MRSLHPCILFHFTTRKGLFGILKNNFFLSYARERIEGQNHSAEFGIPMVSFCDLRLSELKDHMDKYGPYGIGLSKEWANRQDLNPVFYANKRSNFTRDFMAAVQAVYRTLESINDIDELKHAQSGYMGVLNAYRFMKNYEGTLTRSNGEVVQDYRFADEREWRYVPTQAEFEPGFVPPGLMATPSQKSQLNEAARSHRHEFDPDDIRYLIVKTEKERLDLLDHVELVKSRFNLDKRRRLASRVLTAEQIQSDV